MARKKSARAGGADVVPPLGRLLERAKLGFARDVKSYLDAGGAPTAVVRLTLAGKVAELPLWMLGRTFKELSTQHL